jgi:hypothetical protein
MTNAVQKEFEKVWKNDKKMVDFCMKSISGIVKLEDGGYYCFEKHSINTHFCFGYGQNGISTEEDYNDALAAKKNASEKDYFFQENLSIFDDLENLIKYDGKVYSINRYSDNNANLRNLTSDEEEKKWGKIHGTIVSELTPIDRLNLKIELKIQKEKFNKRLETYWKKYGSSKLKTWTYLVD